MSTPEAPLVWTQPFTVRAYEVGPGDIASPLAVVDYFQEVAGEHACALGVESFEIGEAGGAWVLSRLAMEIHRFPRYREALTVETWPSGREGLRATRDLLLRDASGEILVRARTLWFVIDIARRRPVRLPPSVVAIEPPDRPGSLPLGPAPLAPEAVEITRTLVVRQSDLDRNGHANNARFIEWALCAAPEALPLANLKGLDIAFTAEALQGETLLSEASGIRDTFAVSQVSGARESTVAHAILRASDRRLLATACTRWT